MAFYRVACTQAELEEHFGDTTSAHFAFTFTRFSADAGSVIEQRPVRRTVRVLMAGTLLATNEWLARNEFKALFWRACKWAEIEARSGVVASDMQVQLRYAEGSLAASEMATLPDPQGWMCEIEF